MHLNSVTILLGTLLRCAAGATTPIQSRSSYAVKETHNVPLTWTRVGSAPKHHRLELHIGLRQSRFDELERHLYEGMRTSTTAISRPCSPPSLVSDPDHHRYGQHLTADEVEELIQPSSDTLDSAHEWLSQHDITSDQLDYSPAQDWITVTLSVGQVEDLLKTDYSVFKHEDGTYVIRTPEWSLPRHLHDHIDAIQPTNSFLRTSPQVDLAVGEEIAELGSDIDTLYSDPSNPPSDLTVEKACNLSFVTPLCLRTFYGTLDYKPQVPHKNGVGIANYLDETNNRSDVSIFLQKFRPEAEKAAYQFDIQVVAGGDNQQTPDNSTQLAHYKDVEGNLDAETILGIGYPTPLTAWCTGGSPPFKPDLHDPENHNEPYLTWLNYVLKQKKVPQVISNSYADDEQTVPKSYARKVCNQFAQLGARGVTVLFGSGDFGVGKEKTCVSNDGTNSSTFLPAFPASCPYVTTVGATKNFKPEIVAFDATPPKPNPTNFASGGGFSNYFPRPKYQNAAVGPYVKSLGDQFKGLYNPNGRAYPDISAQSQRIVTIWNGTYVILDGTSCSTPLVASILSLVNDALLAEGKSVLGFLNPWLYSRGYQALNDVTSGSAVGCGVKGFPAEKGWDPVTGFGTPVSHGSSRKF